MLTIRKVPQQRIDLRASPRSALLRADKFDSAIRLNAATRVLFFAPHPDDESLAAGGLLQRAAAAHANVKVIFATNGEDNPWPLRVVGKQWKINAHDRLLWGERRRQEARDALDVLGIDGRSAQFLGLRDQRITDLLIREPDRLIRQIRDVLREAKPTLLLAPAPFDLHPDHNAFSILVQLALASEEFSDIERLSYAVHTRGYHGNWEAVGLPLNASEQRVKRLAILRHRTQMALSRRRFMAHVTPRELFWRAAAPCEIDLRHPIRAAQFADHGITLQLARARRAGSFARCTLCFAVEDAHARHAAWLLPLPRVSSGVPVFDAGTETVIGEAEVQIAGCQASVRLAVSAAREFRRMFARLKQPTLFYDRAGWRELPLGAPATSVAASGEGAAANHNGAHPAR